MPKSFDVVIIGGGAAGFFAAINIKSFAPNLSVAILEGSAKALAKVKVSGGGRCNVTHDARSIAELSKAYPRGKAFLKKAFKQFWVPDLIEWFNQKGIRLKVEEDGRMFPESNSSETIIDCFLNEAKRLKVELFFSQRVEKIETDQVTYSIHASQNTFISKKLLIATGGHNKLSQFKYLDNFNLEIENPCPSLFTFNLRNNHITQLMGLSVAKARVVIPKLKKENTAPLLITHWGMSGPAVLVLSSICAQELKELNYEFQYYVDWLPGFAYEDLGFKSPKKIMNLKPTELPKRLWEYLLNKVDINIEKIGLELSKAELNRLKEVVKHDVYEAKGKTTFKEEFVTCGGIELAQINNQTMESKEIKNLFFAGEVLNIDAVTGGFNFQAAWTTAYIAAKNIALQNEN